MDKNKYKLLTPGPLTTTETVKEEMLVDLCTWDDDYKNMTQEIRAELLRLAHAESGYTTVLMQGSGTFGVEAVLSSVIKDTDKLLIAVNGAYSKRMAEICRYHRLPYAVVETAYDTIPQADAIEEALKADPAITHISMVHSETTTGILNDIAAVGEVAKKYGKKFIVDAMSSFGGVDIDVPALGIMYLISSANKCIQGVPGFSFIIAKEADLKETKGTASSLSLDVYAQWETMEKDGGKWRFTSPTHVVAAFRKALEIFRNALVLADDFKALSRERSARRQERRHCCNGARMRHGDMGEKIALDFVREIHFLRDCAVSTPQGGRKAACRRCCRSCLRGCRRAAPAPWQGRDRRCAPRSARPSR